MLWPVAHGLACGLGALVVLLTLRSAIFTFVLPLSAADGFVSRAEWDEACARLRAAGVPLRTDLEQAWRDWAGWRVNYDRVLIALCTLVMAPSAPWSGDRAPAFTTLREMQCMPRLQS